VPMSTEEIQALPAAVPVKKTSEAFGISLDSTYAAIHNGDLPVVRIGKRMLVPKTAILKMLEIKDAL
jgi:excisionase family DNA binding protein